MAWKMGLPLPTEMGDISVPKQINTTAQSRDNPAANAGGCKNKQEEP
jgi:hypothetical protein